MRPVLLSDPVTWVRKTPKINKLLPLLYLHGLSSGNFVPALGQFLGSSTGLSAPVITKLTRDLEGRGAYFLATGSVGCGLRLLVG